MKGPDRFSVYNILETYHELGTFEFKVVLNPRFYKNSHFCGIEVVDSDGKPIPFSLEKWGRKMNCSFTINESVSDGVASAWLSLVGEEGGRESRSRITWWVIKP